MLRFVMDLESPSCSDVTYTLVVRGQDHKPLALARQAGNGDTTLVYSVDLSGYTGRCLALEGFTSQAAVVFDVAPDPGDVRRVTERPGDACVGQPPAQNFK